MLKLTIEGAELNFGMNIEFGTALEIIQTSINKRKMVPPITRDKKENPVAPKVETLDLEEPDPDPEPEKPKTNNTKPVIGDEPETASMMARHRELTRKLNL